tara:strand:+ start:2383 stop:2571 length:189 start_codon:yes stop_codon:yes gene_type:complete
VSAIKVAVWINHLWFDPETKFHASSINMLNQWPKSQRENSFVYSPVAKACTVRFAALEPAII